MLYRNKLIIMGMIGGFIVAIGILYCAYSALTYHSIILPIPTTCTIGISSTAANITLSGIGADQACNKLLISA